MKTFLFKCLNLASWGERSSLHEASMRISECEIIKIYSSVQQYISSRTVTYTSKCESQFNLERPMPLPHILHAQKSTGYPINFLKTQPPHPQKAQHCLLHLENNMLPVNCIRHSQGQPGSFCHFNPHSPKQVYALTSLQLLRLTLKLLVVYYAGSFTLSPGGLKG